MQDLFKFAIDKISSLSLEEFSIEIEKYKADPLTEIIKSVGDFVSDIEETVVFNFSISSDYQIFSFEADEYFEWGLASNDEQFLLAA